MNPTRKNTECALNRDLSSRPPPHASHSLDLTVGKSTAAMGEKHAGWRCHAGWIWTSPSPATNGAGLAPRTIRSDAPPVDRRPGSATDRLRPLVVQNGLRKPTLEDLGVTFKRKNSGFHRGQGPDRSWSCAGGIQVATGANDV